MVAPLFLPHRQPAFPPVNARPPWLIKRYRVVGSTNDIAGRCPAWTAIIARRQLAGRGRYRRHWTSDRGGLWMSAVVPTSGPAARWTVLPLAAGWAVRETLVSLGVNGVRLRWPNDVMIGHAKLAGILVERFTPHTVVIGIGLNLRNHPDRHDAALRGQVVRLADALSPLPPEREIVNRLLEQLRRAQALLACDGLGELLPQLNHAWTGNRVSVELHDSATLLTGRLVAVNENGDLELQTDRSMRHVIPVGHVRQLRELF